MTHEEIIKQIEEEERNARNEIHSAEGLQRLQDVAATYDGQYKLIWSDELLKQLADKPKATTYGTGLSNLDKIIGGFREQQVVTISAHSKHGKTQFGLFLMEKLEALSPVMIPLEQSNEEIVQQRSDNGYSIPRFLSPSKLAARVTVDWIEQRIVEGIAKYNTKLVVIDHLGYVDDFGESGRYAKENLAYRIQMVMQSLKGIAKKWNVIIFLLVHISQGDEGHPPSNKDLKGSSGILQESDMVIFLWRKNDLKGKVRLYSDKTMVSVTANRRTGKNGNIGLLFDKGQYKEDDGWVKKWEENAETQVEMDDF